MASYKSSFLDNPVYLNADVSVEQNYRDIWITLMSKFTSMGWVQASDTGQYNPFATAYLRGSSIIQDTTAYPNASMDNTTTSNTGWKTNNVVPTALAPVFLYLDVGTNLGTFRPLSSRIITHTNAWDPKTYTIDYTDTMDPANPSAATWTPVLVDTTHAALPDLATSNTSYQNLDTAAGHRYYRFGFYNIQGAGTFLRVPEIELYTAASGGGTKFSTIANTGPFTSTNTQTSNFQLWKMNDYAAANGAPFIMKIWVGSGSTAGFTQVWIQGGTATDGAGTFTGGSQTGLVKQISSGAFVVNTSRRTIFCGNNDNSSAGANDGRMSVCLFNDVATTAIWWNIERSKNSDGTDDFTSDNAAVYITMGTYAGTTSVTVIPYAGSIPTAETESTMVLNSNGTSSSIRGNKIAVAPNEPWLGTRQYPLLGTVALWSGEGGNVAETVISTTMYGDTHNYITVGPNVTSVARGSASLSRLALRYE